MSPESGFSPLGASLEHETIHEKIARLSDELGNLEGAAEGSDDERRYLELYQDYSDALRARGVES